MTVPQTNPASPDRPKGATPFGILVGVVTMALWGAAMFAFGGWLLGIYGPALDWGANPTLGIPLGIIPAMVAMHGCRKAHLGEGLTAFLVASVVAAVLAANIVAVAVILWAVSPEMAMGVDGYLAAYVGGVLLSLPVAYGASALLQGWQTTDLQWNEWFPNRHSRYATWVGLVLGGGAFLIYESAHPLLVGWLFTTYPAASGFFLSGARFAVFLAAVSFFFTGSSDLRSALLAALVIFEIAVAGAITAAVMAVTLDSDSLLLSTGIILLTMAVFSGAVLLVAHRSGDEGEEA